MLIWVRSFSFAYPTQCLLVAFSATKDDHIIIARNKHDLLATQTTGRHSSPSGTKDREGPLGPGAEASPLSTGRQTG
jgi:hypothetical protein